MATIKIGKKDFDVQFRFKELLTLEEDFGINLFSGEEQKPSFSLLKKLIQATAGDDALKELETLTVKKTTDVLNAVFTALASDLELEKGEASGEDEGKSLSEASEA